MTTQTVQGQDFANEMKQTELGDFIVKNKVLIIGFALGLIAAIVGHGIYKHNVNKANMNAAEKLYAFETGYLKKFEGGNLTAKELASHYNSLSSELSSTDAFVSTSMIIFDSLFNKGHFVEALNVIEKVNASNPHQVFFVSMRKAAAYEENGKIDEAITILNSLVSGQEKIMEGKLYLDLGRLYIKKNDKDMAKKSFEHVKKITTQKVYKSLASYYLETL